MATPAQDTADLTTIRNSLNLGPSLLPADAKDQHDRILEAAHSDCRGAHGNVDQLTTHNSQSFKGALIETFLGNEANPVSFYRVLAPLKDDDGFAFGPPQWTLIFSDRMQLLKGILSKNQMPPGDIDRVNDLLGSSGDRAQTLPSGR